MDNETPNEEQRNQQAASPQSAGASGGAAQQDPTWSGSAAGAPYSQQGQGWWAAQSGTTPGYHLPPPGGNATAQLPPQAPRPRRKKLYAGVAATALVAGIIGGGVGLGGGYLLADNGGASAPTLVGQAPNINTASLKPGSVEYAAKVAGKSTVDIMVRAGQTGDEGTGIVLSQDGYVLTNNHVVAAAANGGQIQVTLPSGNKKSAKIVGTAPSYDLAVIKVAGTSGLTPAQLGQSKSVQVGEPVAAIGSPFGYAGTVTSGIVSALSRTVTVQANNGQAVVYTGLQTDASINPGNSGGPLVNMDGQVIGVNSSISTGNGQSSSSGQSGSIGIGFSIPVDTARRVANDLMHQGYATKPVLGVSGHIGTSSSAGGARIASVQNGSAAAKAGLKAGDVITKVNNTPVSDYADLMAQILDHQPNQQITLTVKSQGGGSRTVQATLGSEKDQAQTTVPQQQSPFGGQGNNPFGGFGGH